MKAVLDKNAMAVANGVSETEARPNLKCVKIGNGEIAAADGYVLIRRPSSIEGEGSFLIRGDAILKAQRLFEERTTIMESKGEMVVFKEQLPLTLHTDITISTKPLDASFPTLDDKFPTGEIIAQFAIDPRLLKKVLRMIGDAAIIQFRIRDGGRSPIEFVAGEANGLIMPMFVRGKDSGHWHKAKQKQKEK